MTSPAWCTLRTCRLAAAPLRPLRRSARQMVISCHDGATATMRLPAYAPKLVSIANLAAAATLGCAAVGGQWNMDAACLAAYRINTLCSGLLFLAYFCTSLAGSTVPWAARLAGVLRPAADQLLVHCSWTACVQLALVACIALVAPSHISGATAPLFGAAYASLGIIAATQQSQRRPLGARKKLEIEPGEGDRHAVMAQGGRLAARNYCWLIGTLYFGLECVKCAIRVGHCHPLHTSALPEAMLLIGYVAAGVVKFGPFNGD